MKKTLLAIALLTVSSASFAAGFDCEKAGTPVEKMICSNPKLDMLDEQLNLMYKQTLTTDPQIKADQREWVRNVRNKATSVEQMVKAYEERIVFLANYTGEEVQEAQEAPVAVQLPEPVPVKAKEINEQAIRYVVNVIAWSDECKKTGTYYVTTENRLTVDKIINRLSSSSEQESKFANEVYKARVKSIRAMDDKEFTSDCLKLNEKLDSVTRMINNVSEVTDSRF